jgi:hypothetical protein
MDSSARRMAKGVGEVKQVEAKDETKIKHSDHRGTQSHGEVGSKAQLFTEVRGPSKKLGPSSL